MDICGSASFVHETKAQAVQDSHSHFTLIQRFLFLLVLPFDDAQYASRQIAQAGGGKLIENREDQQIEKSHRESPR